MDKSSISELIRKGRARKRLSQAELAERSGLSLRSIQRIEAGEVQPRDHSLRKLIGCLDLEPEISAKETAVKPTRNLSGRIILSIGSLVVLILIGTAFLSQSAGFPETNFELQVFWIVLILLICLVQWKIWVDFKHSA